MCLRELVRQRRIRSVNLGVAISVLFAGQVPQRLRYCKRDNVYFTTLLYQNNGRQNVLISRMLFSGFKKIMMNEVAFAGFWGVIAPS